MSKSLVQIFMEKTKEKIVLICSVLTFYFIYLFYLNFYNLFYLFLCTRLCVLRNISQKTVSINLLSSIWTYEWQWIWFTLFLVLSPLFSCRDVSLWETRWIYERERKICLSQSIFWEQCKMLINKSFHSLRVGMPIMNKLNLIE